jgi:hypothetical protein
MSQAQDGKIIPQGNGKAAPPFDLRNAMLPKRGRSDPQGPFKDFMTSDKNNPAKSRIPNPPGMAVYQLIGLWASPTKNLSYEVQGKRQIFTRSVAGEHDLFKRLFDEDAISHGGKSREEGVTAALGYYLQDIETIQSAQSARLGEKGGASKSK